MRVPIMSNSLQLPPIPVSVLGLSNVEVIKVEIDRSNQFIFTVVSTKVRFSAIVVEN
jgi:hypothetical protein